MKPHCQKHKRYSKRCNHCVILRAKDVLKKLKVGEAGPERIEMEVK